MTQNDFLFFAGFFFLGQKCAAHGRLHANRLEEVCRDVENLNFLRLVFSGEIYFIPGVGGDAIERLRLFLPVEVRCRSDWNEINGAEPAAVALAVLVEQGDVTVGVLEGNWMEEESFGHAEDGGVRADA